ncbi:hypothetical protein ATKI12_1959 [Kitasatospora sp. Ki12]
MKPRFGYETIIAPMPGIGGPGPIGNLRRTGGLHAQVFCC